MQRLREGEKKLQVLDSQNLEIKAGTRRLFVYGVFLVVLGVLAIMAPRISGIAVQLMLGWLLVLAGIAWTMYASHARSWGSGLWEALVGILAVMGGVIIIARPLLSLEILTWMLAVYFIATGVLKLALAFELKPTRGWGWTLFNGVISVFLGAIVMRQWPFSGLWLVGTMVGIDMIFGGFSLMRLSSAAREG
jgi:uncharacterized membrane protein HdeD (DUF308 family)